MLVSSAKLEEEKRKSKSNKKDRKWR